MVYCYRIRLVRRYGLSTIFGCTPRISNYHLKIMTPKKYKLRNTLIPKEDKWVETNISKEVLLRKTLVKVYLPLQCWLK